MHQPLTNVGQFNPRYFPDSCDVGTVGVQKRPVSLSDGSPASRRAKECLRRGGRPRRVRVDQGLHELLDALVVGGGGLDAVVEVSDVLEEAAFRFEASGARQRRRPGEVAEQGERRGQASQRAGHPGAREVLQEVRSSVLAWIDSCVCVVTKWGSQYVVPHKLISVLLFQRSVIRSVDMHNQGLRELMSLGALRALLKFCVIQGMV